MSWFVIRLHHLSFRIDRRVPLVIGGLVLAILGAGAINLSLGTYPISLPEVVATVVSPTDADHAFVIHQLRMPRTLLAVLVGMGLAVSGAILQGLTGNNLAAPGIIGVNAGAAATVVASIIVFPQISVTFYPLAAMIGAFGTAGVIYRLAWRDGLAPLRLILVGIAVGAVANAVTATLVALGDIERVMGAFIWLAGSINASGWKHVLSILPWLAAFIPTAWLLARQLNLFSMGDEVAAGLGMRVEWTRFVLIVASVALAAAAIAVAGTVGFVGLMAPHIARQMVGPSHEGLLPTSALTGGLTVLVADTLGRNLFAPLQIPVGIVTAIIGVPFFLYLLYRYRDHW